MSLPPAAEIEPLDWAAWGTRYLFFTGKGGVGKTTTASAVAVALADAGQWTLLISTDPASNLDDVFGIRAGAEPTPIPGVAGLSVANLDPEQAAAAFKERAVAPYRGVLPDAAIASMEEQLSGACTLEVAAFNEFTAVLATPEAAAGYDHVIFDTAPTGHTLRLLTLPGAWSGYVSDHPAGASCLGPLAGLDQRQEQYAAAVTTLADPASTTLVLVTRAEGSALTEAARASTELAALGVANQRLIVNGLLQDPGDDRVARRFAERQTAALAGAPAALADLPVAGVALSAAEMTGVAALRRLVAGDTASATSAVGPADDPVAGGAPGPFGLPELIDALDDAGHGVVMTMGKGGVGKTTIAAALALALSERGHEVTLSTTDPAAHLTAALAGAEHPGLRIERIDPVAETARYAAEVFEAAAGLDAAGRALLEEDLRSPCTEEIAVFRAFARTVDAARKRVVVLDTAPTGHTLLLLDATQSYEREVKRSNAEVPAEVSGLLGRLRDPAFARMLVVTLPESTPVLEAERLQNDLIRAGIRPYGWIINAAMVATGSGHPTLAARAAAERRQIAAVAGVADRVWLVGWQPDPPVGRAGLSALADLPDPAAEPAPLLTGVR
ncbi:arsenical pump-driving ATPase [Conexibacter sp. DBS9H8]|uniref:arsenical pump-driving ATPase n=1 Tax=Conexibacter sp. DBS9H8 TaxID=2937801 RepID=UPI00200CCA6B|nr:arsenical pump-driving ATPase [Conexibacter sp. DBS9H8]